MKKLPKTIYVKWESVRQGDEPYMVVGVKPEHLGELNENIVVGVYQLVNKGTIVSKPELLLEA